MEFSQDQIAAIVGAQHLELVGLRIALARAEQRIKELSSPKQESSDASE